MRGRFSGIVAAMLLVAAPIALTANSATAQEVEDEERPARLCDLQEAASEIMQSRTRTGLRNLSNAIGNRLAALRAGRSESVAARDNLWQQFATAAGLAQADTPEPAGNPDRRFGVWANYDHTRLRGSRSETAYSGPVHSATLGADYVVSDGVIVGALVNFEYANMDLRTQGGRQRTRGGLVGIYAAYGINDWLMADANLLLGRYRNRADTRLRGASSRGSYTSWRYGGAVRLTAQHGFQPDGAGMPEVNLLGSLAYRMAWDKPNSYRDNNGVRVDPRDTRLGTIALGGELGLRFEQIEPFFAPQFEYDLFHRGAKVPRTGVLLGGGARLHLDHGISATLSANTEVLRSRHSERTVSFFLRVAF